MASRDQIEALTACKEEIAKFIDENNCAPIMIRLAWHDSGNYDKSIAAWPACGGANASIRFEPEIDYPANGGLAKALNFLKAFKKKYPAVSWADLIQMASACAVEVTGGPKIPMKYGRVDAADASACPEQTSRGTSHSAGLPDPMPDAESKQFPCGAKDPATHLRNIFNRLGFDDEGIVALSGAHTLGRAFAERSGTTESGYGDKKASKYTKSACPVRHDGQEGVGMSGGKAWTKNWLTFDNSYFQYLQRGHDDELLWFSTDAALHQDEKFKPYFEKFAASQDAFFEAYSRAHKKLSELGSNFEPAQGITVPAAASKL